MKNKTIYKQIWYDYNQCTNWIDKQVKEWREIRPDVNADREFIIIWLAHRLPIKIQLRYEYCIYKNLLAKYGWDIKAFCIEKTEKNTYEIPPEFKRPLFMIMQSYLVNYFVKNDNMSTAHYILTGVWK